MVGSYCSLVYHWLDISIKLCPDWSIMHNNNRPIENFPDLTRNPY